MNTKVIRENIDEAAALIAKGALVAVPTETVYGLAGNGLDAEAVERIYEVKGRPEVKPLSLMVPGQEAMERYCEDVPPQARALAERFWPGPLTMILRHKPIVPDAVTAGLDTVGMRCPAHPVCRAIIAAAGVPVAAPSGNTSGRPSPTNMADMLEDMDGKIDGIVDGGPCAVGVESTIIDLTCTPPRLLRPGGITLEQLREVLPEVQVHKSVLNSGMVDKAASPGMKYKHYSPRARVVIACELETAKLAYDKAAQAGLKVWLLASETQIEAMPGRSGAPLYSQSHPEQAAQRLFALLREADVLGKDLVIALWNDQTGVGLSVTNRLLRASGFTVLSEHGQIEVGHIKVGY